MRLLLLASPKFFEIALGVFGFYLTFSWVRTYKLPLLFLIIILFYTILVAIAGIAGLIGLSKPNSSASRVEYIFEDLVRAGVAIHTALLLHPSCSLAQSIQHLLLVPKILYLIIGFLLFACGMDIVSIYATHIPRTLSAVFFILASCVTVALLLFVSSFEKRIQPNRRDTVPWLFIAAIQLLAIAISILDLSSSSYELHCALEFCLVGWITGTLWVISELGPFPRKQWPAASEPRELRRIPHVSVSEDFQACPDPFAGPLEMGQLPTVIPSSFSPPVPKSIAISTLYSKSSRQRHSFMRRSRSSASNSSCGPFQFDTTKTAIGRRAMDIQVYRASSPTPNHTITSVASKPGFDNNGITPSLSLEGTNDRRPYFSSSSTRWLLSQSDLSALPSPPPLAHLAPVKSKRSYDPIFPPLLGILSIPQVENSGQGLARHSNPDRTPTQSLYHSTSLRSLRSPLSSFDGSTTPNTVIRTTGLYSQVNTLDHFDKVRIPNYSSRPNTGSSQISPTSSTIDQNSARVNSDNPSSSNGSLLGKLPAGSIPSIPSLPSTYSVNLIYSTPTSSTPSIPSLPSMPSMTSIPSLVETPDQTFSSTLIGSGDIPNADDSLLTQTSDVGSVPDTPLSPSPPSPPSSNPKHSLHAKLHASTERDFLNPNGCETVPVENPLEREA